MQGCCRRHDLEQRSRYDQTGTHEAQEVGNLVDTIAAESLEITKRQSRDKATAEAEEARVHEARNCGIRHCRVSF